MYIALESFTTKNYDVRRKQILEEDFTTQDEIQEYLNIGYIEEYDGTLEITENGQYNVEDYETADVNVSGGEVNLQNKSVTITENGTQTISADTGYDGLESVAVTTSVSGSDYNAQLDFSKTGDPVKKIVKIGTVNTTGITSLKNAFYDATNLVSIGQMDTSSITNMQNMFFNCSNLTTIPTLNTSSTTNFNRTFWFNNAMETAPNLDLSHATNVEEMFANCAALKNVPTYNLANVTSLDYWFSWDSVLTDESLNNIMASLLTATSHTGTKTLKIIFNNQPVIINKCTTLSNWAALETAGWTTGI